MLYFYKDFFDRMISVFRIIPFTYGFSCEMTENRHFVMKPVTRNVHFIKSDDKNWQATGKWHVVVQSTKERQLR